MSGILMVMRKMIFFMVLKVRGESLISGTEAWQLVAIGNQVGIWQFADMDGDGHDDVFITQTLRL